MKASPITSRIRNQKATPVKVDGGTSENKATEGSGMQSDKPEEKSWGNIIGHGVLDVVGLIPGVGEIADGINAGWYAAEGDYKNAALSAAAMVPFAGWGATATKVGMKIAPKATKVIKGTTQAAKKSKILNNKVGRTVTGEAGRFLDKPTKYARTWRGTDQAINKALSDDSGKKNGKIAMNNNKPNVSINKNLGSNRVAQGSSSWKRAVANNKSDTSLTNLVKQRNSAKKGSAEYAKAQNAINKAYGSKKRY
jgi:hypothetical protein